MTTSSNFSSEKKGYPQVSNVCYGHAYESSRILWIMRILVMLRTCACNGWGRNMMLAMSKLIFAIYCFYSSSWCCFIMARVLILIGSDAFTEMTY